MSGIPIQHKSIYLQFKIVFIKWNFILNQVYFSMYLAHRVQRVTECADAISKKSVVYTCYGDILILNEHIGRKNTTNTIH